METLVEEQGDLFDLDDSWSLAHCVGADLIMGKGIAVEFKKKFGNVDWLLQQNGKVGQTILMNKSIANRNVFYMITKPWSRSSKPTYDNIQKCIIDLFNQAKAAEIRKIGMPKIGCGLDGKDWDQVKKLIIKHQPPEIQIVIRYISN